ncbi:MAG: hypothetical protein RSD67_05170 [Oscillospiraceae bacterium]
MVTKYVAIDGKMFDRASTCILHEKLLESVKEKAKLEREKSARQSELIQAFERYKQLVADYIRDYPYSMIEI